MACNSPIGLRPPSPSHRLMLNSNLAFADYIKKTKAIIAKTRLDLDNQPELIVEANSPFELRPKKFARNGILLIHGLFDSPGLLKDMGQHFYQHDFLVRAILLPGH